MLELMNKHKKINHFMWAVLIATTSIFFIKFSPDFLAALADFWIKVRG